MFVLAKSPQSFAVGAVHQLRYYYKEWMYQSSYCLCTLLICLCFLCILSTVPQSTIVVAVLQLWHCYWDMEKSKHTTVVTLCVHLLMCLLITVRMCYAFCLLQIVGVCDSNTGGSGSIDN